MSNPIAVVSGATGGIGMAVTRKLWHDGYDILAIGHSVFKCHALSAYLTSCRKKDQWFRVVPCDLRNEDDMTQLGIAYANFGTASLLVTCHGAPPHPTDAISTECASVTERIWQCDVLATLRLCQIVAPSMRQRGEGCIVLLSSIHAHATYPQRLPYAISKAAVCAMARSLALEFGRDNIRVNSISPWQVNGERTDAFISDALQRNGIDLLQCYLGKTPLRRLVDAEDIATTVTWLATNRSITGRDIALDCGVLASMWYKSFAQDGEDNGEAIDE